MGADVPGKATSLLEGLIADSALVGLFARMDECVLGKGIACLVGTRAVSALVGLGEVFVSFAFFF